MASNQETMKAIRLERDSPDTPPTVSLATVPKPKLIPNHVIVKVRASAIHPSDQMNARGGFPYTTFPRIAGRDWAGVVVEGKPALVGLEVFGTSGNTHAFTTDGFQAEYTLVHEDALTQKPKNLSFVQAATVGVPYTTASIEIEKAGIKKTDTVLVIGSSGAVGSAVVQLAKDTGARVLEASRQNNTDVNTATDPELKALDELTNGKGVDVVIDTVGSPALVTSALAKLALDGRFVFISAPKTGSTEITIDLRYFYRKDLSLYGVNSLNATTQEMAERLDGMREFFDSEFFQGRSNWKTVPLAEAGKVYENIIKNGDTGKYVVVME
ncbi:unnamed protein product [Clonostachys rhizophaga]|uniref:Enoyl reductase (ER) domain-containing protein n=1 Tax=Clonostachys rhizophaga TaxID=160324 RepID=A0A9N9VND9_9HYPO|nr:unnamed protein product [Clonostachys rhizophaga]